MRAEGLVAERGEHYGDPIANHDRIAALWSAYLGTKVRAHDVALCMVLVKVSRSKVDPKYGDNYDDIAGYAQVAREVAP